MILFLDFDGVLHPDEVYRYRKRGIVLKTANLPEAFQHLDLFCYADILADALDGFEHVRIVLSTSWVPTLGYTQTLARLPDALRRRVIGATYHSRHTPRWNDQTRYEQIRENVVYRGLGADWVAIDNDDWGWPDDQRDRLVHTDDYTGVADPAVLEEFKRRLSACAPSSTPGTLGDENASRR